MIDLLLVRKVRPGATVAGSKRLSGNRHNHDSPLCTSGVVHGFLSMSVGIRSYRKYLPEQDYGPQ